MDPILNIPILNSDAGHWTIVALLALAVAATAWLGDRRRMRRTSPDRVGFMPWGGLFLAALGVAGISAMLAAKLWIAPI